MKVDPRNLRVADAVRLLNSTSLGEVVQPHTVYRHLNRAGYRIGDGKKIDLLRYAAWLFHARSEQGWGDGNYEQYRDDANAHSRQVSESTRDIASEGWVHETKDADRKQRCSSSFRLFCETYFHQTFHMKWSPDHLKVIGKIETAVLQGGLFAMAMPRGSGKTSLCEVACLWSLLYGHRDFIALIGSDEEHAEEMLESIKSELENNVLIEEDFSEVAGPIRALEGIHQRAAGQLYQTHRTHIEWTAKEIVLPTIAGSQASAGIIRVTGITGRIRGMKYKRPDGKTVRPSLVLLDDPQTDESARSPAQCAAREQILAGAILGLAGPGKKIAGLMTLTVVRPGDMADRLLDRDKHPQWQGERTKMLYSLPSNEKLWAQYAEIRASCLKNDRGTAEATEFYRRHRAAMDLGTVVAWPQRHHPDELSAIQHAMNLRLDHGDAAFRAEYQNEPSVASAGDGTLLTADEIAGKLSGLPRGQLPASAQYVTAFIDVHDNVLFYAVCGWASDFDGWVIDYGAYPEQHEEYFTLRRATQTLQMLTPGAGREGAIRAGLDVLTQKLISKQWHREDGAALRMSKCLVDAGYVTDIVHDLCRHSVQAAVLMPSRGVGIGAAGKPIAEYNRTVGDQIGFNWYITKALDRNRGRHLRFDTNFWKSFVVARLRVAMGDKGSLSLFGNEPEEHRLLADHFLAEQPVQTFGQGRSVEEWKIKPDRPDNHLLDCVVGCTAAASLCGAILYGTVQPPKPRKRVSLSQMQREAWARNGRVPPRSTY